MCGVGMILHAQWTGGMLLFADGVVMSEGKAVFTVRCSCSSVEYRDTMCHGEESNSMAQNIGVLWGESDGNRRCYYAFTFSGVRGQKPDLPPRNLPSIRNRFRYNFKKDLFILEGTEVFEEVKWDGMDSAIDARGSELEGLQRVFM